MDLFRLTRELIDIESISGNEAAVGEYLLAHLGSRGYEAHRMPVEGTRFNVYAAPKTKAGKSGPQVVLSTHMDTVPPFIASSEDDDAVRGRGSCDAKGIIASQIAAADRLNQQGVAAGLLFVVGEERDSLGAKVANTQAKELAPNCKLLINGEPTDNRIAIASKGALRAEIIASGKMAHSAYPHLGESAINKLVAALHKLLQMSLPENPEVGPSTVNIGVIEGGRAPNVIPDHARAQLLYRLVGPSDELKQRIVETVGEAAKVDFVLEIPFMKFRTVEAIPQMVAAFTTDIPKLTNWGEPVLLGPGSIHVAHTDREFVPKRELVEAVDLYCKIASEILR